MTKTNLEGLSDEQVIEALDDAVRDERHSTARVVRCLIEFERRRLHQRRAYPSVFVYCTRHLGYSEEAAYKRIRAARAAGEHEAVLDQLERGAVKLSAIVAISSQLSSENRDELIEKARTLPKRDMEFFVAGLAPKEVARDCIRTWAPVGASPALPRPAAVEPVTGQLARVSFNADRQTVADIDRACALLHQGRPGARPHHALEPGRPVG